MNAPSTISTPAIAKELRENIKRFILNRLGYPIVKIEITNATLDVAIDEAVRRFSQWVPGGEKLSIFDTVAQQSEYDLTEIVPDYINIREVIYNPSVTDVFLTSFLGGITTDFSFGSNQISYFHGTYSSMTDYTIWNMYNEMYLRTIGREGQWRTIGNSLILSPAPYQNVKCGLIYTSMLLDIDMRRDEWVREWALTEVKLSLGAVRGKYSGGIPGPRGDTIQMDGERLITEAREDQNTLRERLNEFRDPVLITLG